MSDIYDRAKASAASQLAPRSKGGKGLEMTLRRTIPGEYDPETGTSPDTTTDYLGSALRQEYDLKDIDGTLIKAGDVLFLISPLLLDGSDMPEPETQDIILFDGQQYTAQSVSPGNYAGLSCFFEVQGRK